MQKLRIATGVLLFIFCIKVSAVPLNASTCLSADELKELKSLSEKDDIAATRKLFVFYASCVGDKDQALLYAKRRAEIGTAQDVVSYATTLESSNTRESFDWYLKAAQMGDSRAKQRVAEAYRDGTGTIKDLNQAFIWFQLGATCQEFGADDMEDLAQFLLDHKPVPLYDVKALAWLDVVAEDNSMSTVGKTLRDGLLSKLSKEKIVMAENLANEFSVDSGCAHPER